MRIGDGLPVVFTAGSNAPVELQRVSPTDARIAEDLIQRLVVEVTSRVGRVAREDSRLQVAACSLSQALGRLRQHGCGDPEHIHDPRGIARSAPGTRARTR